MPIKRSPAEWCEAGEYYKQFDDDLPKIWNPIRVIGDAPDRPDTISRLQGSDAAKAAAKFRKQLRASQKPYKFRCPLCKRRLTARTVIDCCDGAVYVIPPHKRK